MALKLLMCPSCGAEKLEARTINGEPGFYCTYCGKEFREEIGVREYEKLESIIKAGLGSVIDEAIMREKINTYYHLRSLLWGKITATYIDSAAIVNICRDILAIAQHDFVGEFFEVANSATPQEVAEYIQNIDEVKNAAFVDLALDFLIKSMREEYITPTAALLERCGRIFTPEKKQDFLTRFELEAARVTEGIYETSIVRDVFLAYSSKDMPAVIKVLNFIESNGLTCFAAFRNLQHGRDAVMNYEHALEDAINHCSIFVFVSSVNSRTINCDAFKKEISYIRNTEMAKHPECRAYDQLPEKYRKLRIEYRLDNKPTPLVDRNIKEFFAGQTYAEDYNQLIAQLGECIDKLNNPYIEKEPAQPEPSSKPSFDLTDKATFAEMFRMFNEESKRAEEEAKRKTEEEAKRRAEEEAKRKTEEEAKRKAEEEAKRKAEEEAKRRAEEEAKRKAEEEAKLWAMLEAEEAKRKAEEEAKRKAEEEAKLWAILEAEEAKRKAEEEAKRKAEAEAKRKVETEARRKAEEEVRRRRNSELSLGFDIENGVLKAYNGKNSYIQIPTSVTKIDGFAFNKCKNLIGVIVPESVTCIANSAFYECTTLTKVMLPNSIKDIDACTFYGCTALTSITIPNTVTTIGNSAFYGCSALENITIPANVNVIGDWAFYNCNKLTNIKVHTNNKSFKSVDGNLYSKGGKTLVQYAIGKTNTSFDVPSEVTNIGRNAFANNKTLTNITLPTDIKNIGDRAFYGCDNLKNIVIPDNLVNVLNIGKDAFPISATVIKNSEVKRKAEEEIRRKYLAETERKAEEASKLEAAETKNFNIKNGELVKYLGSDQKVIIPAHVTSIGPSAFSECKSVTSIIIQNRVTSIGSSAFYECVNLHSITISESVTNINENAFNYCFNLSSITVNSNNKCYKSVDGNLYTRDGKTFIRYAIGKKATSFTIPNSVTTINNFAFSMCERLTKITIPDSVTNIDYQAFYYTNKYLSLYLHPQIDISNFAEDWNRGHKLYNNETGKPFSTGGFLKKLFGR